MFEGGKKKKMLTGKQMNNLSEMVGDLFNVKHSTIHKDGTGCWEYETKPIIEQKGMIILKKVKGGNYSFEYKRLIGEIKKNRELET